MEYVRPGIVSAVFYVLTRFLTFVVPAFLFASALKTVMKYKIDEFNYIKFIIDRIKKIYVPYLIWVVLYYLYFVFRLKYFPFDIVELLKYILYGDLAAQFYFIVIIMQFYLLMPLWKKMCEKIPFIISLILAFSLTYFTRIFMPKIFPDFMYFDRIFPAYLIFWVVGCYLGYHYKKYIETLAKYRAVVYLSALLLSAHVFLQYLNFCGFIYYQYSGWVHTMFCFVFTLAFYMLVRDGLELIGKSMVIFKESAKVSFYVFLIHVLVLFETAHWLGIFNITSVTVRFFIRAFFTYVIPFAATFVYVKIKEKVRKNLSKE